MKSIRLVLALATVMAVSSVAVSQAATRVKPAGKGVHARTMFVAASAASKDSRCCDPYCDGKSASTTTRIGACKGVDPSRCPAPCRRDAANAVAANANH